MAVSEQVKANEYKEIEEEEESSSESEDSDPEYDPTNNIFEDTHAKFSNLSIEKKSKSRSRLGKDLDMDVVIYQDETEVDEKSFEIVQKILEAGQLEKLKVEQCKVYLRKYGLRLTGNKATLIQRIKEHLEIVNGEGEKKYPVSSFVLNCKGDACTGDVVMFEQNVYEMYNIASRSASGPPCGTRVVAGRIVKESYGAAKQQHTFTIEVLWSKGEKPLAPLHPLLIKGRNLYRLKTLRQSWEDEGERQKVLMEKHLRGFHARSNRETRIQEKERRKKFKTNRVREEPKRSQSELNLMATHQARIPDLSVDSSKVASGSQRPAVEPQQPALSSIDSRKPAPQPQFSVVLNKPTIPPQYSFDSGKLPLHSQQQSEVQHQEYNFHANGRQPLQNINHYRRPMSPPQKRPVQSNNHYQRPMTPPQRRPVQSTNHYQRPMSPPQRRPVQNNSTNYYHRPMSPPPRQPVQSSNINYYHRPMSPPPRRPGVQSNNTNHYHRPMSPPPRQPAQSTNHCLHRPMSPQPQRQENMKQQLCKYYPQGRCHFGPRCKFVHDSSI